MKVRFRFFMLFWLLIPALSTHAAEAETSHARRCREKHIDPDTKTVLFRNCSVTDLEPFRSALKAYFDRTPVLRQLESSVELDLASVLPDFIVKNLGQKPPVESNCHNTAFYLAGAAPGPYSFEFNGNQSFPDHWVRLGIAETIKAKDLSDLKTGDVLTFDNHSIFSWEKA